jgi:TPR repeat protein
MSLPPATILSVPIYDFAIANTELAAEDMDAYYPCCGKSICRGCFYSFRQSGNMKKCPFCNSDRAGKTDEEDFNELTKRVEVNDAGATFVMATYYFGGVNSCPLDRTKAMELYARAADLGSSRAHFSLGITYYERADLKKAKFHYEAAAMAGHEAARHNLGCIEYESGNMERAVKHCIIASSAGHFAAMGAVRIAFDKGLASRDAIDSALTLYNNSCAEMRSEARDAFIRMTVDHAAER